jgi:hypothetical protein
MSGYLFICSPSAQIWKCDMTHLPTPDHCSLYTPASLHCSCQIVYTALIENIRSGKHLFLSRPCYTHLHTSPSFNCFHFWVYLCWPTFRNPLSGPSSTASSLQGFKLGIHPKVETVNTEHSKSLKSRITIFAFYTPFPHPLADLHTKHHPHRFVSDSA